MSHCVLVTETEFSKAEAIFRAESQFNIESAPTDERRLAERVRAGECRAAILGALTFERTEQQK